MLLKKLLWIKKLDDIDNGVSTEAFNRQWREYQFALCFISWSIATRQISSFHWKSTEAVWPPLNVAQLLIWWHLHKSGIICWRTRFAVEVVSEWAELWTLSKVTYRRTCPSPVCFWADLLPAAALHPTVWVCFSVPFLPLIQSLINMPWLSQKHYYCIPLLLILELNAHSTCLSFFLYF